MADEKKNENTYFEIMSCPSCDNQAFMCMRQTGKGWEVVCLTCKWRGTL